MKHIFIMDSYSGDIQCDIPLPTQSNPTKLNYRYTAAFTHDSMYVWCGTDNGTVQCYECSTGQMVHHISGYHDSVPHVQCSPTQHCIATTQQKQLVMCLPSV